MKDRTLEFALENHPPMHCFPEESDGRRNRNQLLRAGTSPGAHFREATRARSKAEYVAKMNGGLMELEETLYWLDLAERDRLIAEERIVPLKQETEELIAIFVSLINKWRRK